MPKAHNVVDLLFLGKIFGVEGKRRGPRGHLANKVDKKPQSVDCNSIASGSQMTQFFYFYKI